MKKIKEFNNDYELNEFLKANVKNIKNNYSIEIYKCQRNYLKEMSYPTERFIIPYEQIIYVLKYETIEELGGNNE